MNLDPLKSENAQLAQAAQTFLFVPGDRPDRFDKALAAGADMVIIDLEDAVGPDDKNSARQVVRDWLSHTGTTRVAVRINASGTSWHSEDLAALSSPDQVLVLPKAKSPIEITASPLIALVETATGLCDAREIAATASVIRLAFGSFDLAAEIDVDPLDHESMLLARSHLVLASAAAQLPAPIDGVFADVTDPAGLSAETTRSRALGFGAKLCIHPSQPVVVASAFAPTANELAWAHQIAEAVANADDPAVITVAGRMVDRPVIERAHRVIARAQSIHLPNQEQS